MAAILISGAGRGIGLALTQQLVARGDRVIALCRSTSDALLQIEGIRIITDIDVTDETAIQHLVAQLDKQPIDVIVHNAGVMTFETLQDLDLQRIRRQLDINTVAPLRITQALLPNLRAGSKIVLITSRMGSIDDNSSGGSYGYRMSKAALNSAGKSLAVDLKSAGISVGIFHPGMVATDMTAQQGIDASEAAANLINRIDQLSLENSGQFFHANGDPLPW
ncbi:MAG: short-chain dehydrogenase/reductase superfamily protein [Verrucomicrobiaceae bacterium]|nr:short-chain dehydrogenase/reductase superfamily protein [Verrucomicrobiaceae bacterium]